MKGPLCFGLVALLLLEVLGSVLAVDRQTYVMVGGSLDLRPKASSEHFNNILWKHNGNLVVEWVENKVPVEFYSTFKGRSKLDTTNGRLEIDGMTKADSGFYSTEINNLVQSDRYDVKVIRAVPVPEVTRKPLTCGTGSDQSMCTLACNGFEIKDAEPITYSWKRDGEVIPDLSSANLTITNDEETRRVKTYSCLIQNPVSEKESKAYDNPFFKEEGSQIGLVVGLVIVVLAVGGVGGFLWWYRKNKQNDNHRKKSDGPVGTSDNKTKSSGGPENDGLVSESKP